MGIDVIMFSGGPDSLIGFWKLVNEGRAVKGVYVPLGHKYEDIEMEVCKKFKIKWGMDIEIMERYPLGRFEQEDANIPARNLLLALVGSQLSDNVWLAVQREEMEIPDRSEYFFDVATDFLSFLFGRSIYIDTPVRDLTKTEMVTWFLEDCKTVGDRDLKMDMLKDSVSCYSGITPGCGKCRACFRRWVAFSLNGINEEYGVKPWYTNVAAEYMRGIISGKYKGQRKVEILRAMKKVGVDGYAL